MYWRSFGFLVFVCLLPRGAANLWAQQQSSTDQLDYFEKHIRPLLIEHCYGCHSEKSGQSEGGLLLDQEAGWLTGGDQGPAITSGKPDRSLIVRAIGYDDPDLQMPPDKPLSAEQIAHVKHWISDGAHAPSGKFVLSDTAKDPSDPVAGRSHWALAPLAGTTVPEQHNEWAQSPIDAYVLQSLIANGLSPGGPSRRETLLRRLSIQMTGVPPSPQQVDRFVNDPREDYRERWIDQLLSTRRYAERFARHWLDLARYADSNGLDENFLFREAWRYRNWVIDAVGNDMPYDEFLLQQIAGDLLPHTSVAQRDSQRIAAGFMVIGPKVLLGNNGDERRMDIADEQLDTIGRAVLGQSLGCARCHDHKFDPIPTADYYALAGILTSTSVMETRFMLGQQRYMEQLIGLGEDGDQADEEYERYWRERSKLQERQKKAAEALMALRKNDNDAFGKVIEKHADAIAPGAKDESASWDQRVVAQETLFKELEQAFKNPPAIPARAMIPKDRDKIADESIRIAGKFNKPGDKVPRGVLRVISPDSIPLPDDQSGRVELAQWLTDVADGSGVLAARVLANRIWYHMMGRGLVRTVDNFGRTGEAPTHPELLDYLAGRLIESGWSIKALVREIALSESFAMSSEHRAEAHDLDPENRWLWRAHRRRLDPESLRDSMMQAANVLDNRPMDSTVGYLGDQATAVGDNKNRRRTDYATRSVYLPVIRNDLPELFDVFDFADPHRTTGMRPETMVAPQGLFIMNDPSVMDYAASLARLIAKEDSDLARVELLYRRTLGVLPTDDQLQRLRSFVDSVKQQLEQVGHEDPVIGAWTVAAHSLFASSPFQILE